MPNPQETKKLFDAIRILNRCVGPQGVWADPRRYKYTCWTRDFALAIQRTLYLLGLPHVARAHMESLRQLQRPDGRIPILFLDNETEWVRKKEGEARQKGRESFMLRRYKEGELWDLTPGTKDSELMYLFALAQDDGLYLPRNEFDDSAQAAGVYISQNLLRKDGLIVGCDWRDTMDVQFANTPLLSNNAILHDVLRMTHNYERAAKLRTEINRQFWRNGILLDHPESDRFDPLGASLAVLFGLIEPENYPNVIRGYQSVDTQHGVTIKCRHNPYQPEEADIIEATDGEVVWPFVVGFSVLALAEIPDPVAQQLAREQYQKLVNLDGLYEWYDPNTGKGYGATEQLWSACMFIRAFHRMHSGMKSY